MYYLYITDKKRNPKKKEKTTKTLKEGFEVIKRKRDETNQNNIKL